MRRVLERVRAGGSRSGVSADLPVIVIEALQPGPTVAVTANLHGDEVTGTAAVHALDGLLLRELRCGRVVLYPSLNPLGLALRQRTWPEDGLDLNRLFPGDATGGPAARHAARIWADLQLRDPAVLIDLHADSALGMAYAIADRAVSPYLSGGAALQAETERLCGATGLTCLLEYPEATYLRFHLDRSLTGAVVNRMGKPALTIEAGPRRWISPDEVQQAVRGVMGVLFALDMVDCQGIEVRAGKPTHRRASAPRVRRPGLWHPALRHGEGFVAGALLGEVLAIEGDVLDEVRADAEGFVLSWAESAWIEAGGVPGTLALVEGT